MSDSTLTQTFPPDMLPARSGVYQTKTIDPETGDELSDWAYSLYDSTDRIWGCSSATPEGAYANPDYEFALQTKVWRGILGQL